MKKDEYYNYNDLIGDMRFTISNLDNVVAVMKRLCEAGWLPLYSNDFENFAKEALRIGALLHLNLREAEELQEKKRKEEAEGVAREGSEQLPF